MVQHTSFSEIFKEKQKIKSNYKESEERRQIYKWRNIIYGPYDSVEAKGFGEVHLTFEEEESCCTVRKKAVLSLFCESRCGTMHGSL